MNYFKKNYQNKPREKLNMWSFEAKKKRTSEASESLALRVHHNRQQPYFPHVSTRNSAEQIFRPSPPWLSDRISIMMNIHDLIMILEKIGHIPNDIVSELNRLIEENLVHSSVSLLGDTLVKLASRPDSDETNSSS